MHNMQETSQYTLKIHPCMQGYSAGTGSRLGCRDLFSINCDTQSSKGRGYFDKLFFTLIVYKKAIMLRSDYESS